MTPYSMARSVDADGVVWFSFTANSYPLAAPLVLSPDDYQSGAAMRRDVLAWIGTLV